MKKRLVLLALNLVLLGGFAAVVYGVWLIYPPAGWVIGGGIAAGLALFVYGDIKKALK